MSPYNRFQCCCCICCKDRLYPDTFRVTIAGIVDIGACPEESYPCDWMNGDYDITVGFGFCTSCEKTLIPSPINESRCAVACGTGFAFACGYNPYLVLYLWFDAGKRGAMVVVDGGGVPPNYIVAKFEEHATEPFDCTTLDLTLTVVSTAFTLCNMSGLTVRVRGI